jgi:hypothetical protein
VGEVDLVGTTAIILVTIPQKHNFWAHFPAYELGPSRLGNIYFYNLFYEIFSSFFSFL